MTRTQQFKKFLRPIGIIASIVASLLLAQSALKFAQAVGPSPQSTPSAQTPPSKPLGSKRSNQRTSGKIPWWELPDPGSYYVPDKQGRIILGVCRIDGAHPGRPKKDIRHLDPPDKKPGDHRGHSCPENLVDNTDRVNTPYNITAENGKVNLGAKRKFENLARKIKEENPNSIIYFVTEPMYKGEGKRPVAQTYSIMNNKGEVLETVTILNNEPGKPHTRPDRGGTSFFREKVEASNNSTSTSSKASSSSAQRSQTKLFDTALAKVGNTSNDTGVLDKVLFGNDKSAPSNKAAKSAPGGIDFSTLELRYIAEDSSPFADRGLRYAFNATPAAGNKNLNAGRIAAAQASDAFFVWLSLTPDKFWVNLNPNEPDRIIDPQFGKTDAGRILLQSDLQMKKTVAKLIHPDAPLGKQFWKQLNWKDSKTCISFRQWIVPAPATVRDDSNGIYITDAPLQVKMESQYFQSKGTSGFLASCSTLDKKTEVRNESIYRKLILPRIEEAVNKAPEYAELRRVYRSRVAAEWYRQRSESKATAYREMVNNGDVSSWPARQNWSPKQVFNQYVNSFTKGEFHVVHNSKWQEGNIIYTQKKFYVYGGVDFSRVFFKKLSSTDFQKKWGDLRQVTDSSMKSPIADQNGKVWLGGITITGKAFWKSIWFYLIPGTLIALFLIYKIRTRRIRWQ
jgi:hypothetical protein